jgi:hypothetical protein
LIRLVSKYWSFHRGNVHKFEIESLFGGELSVELKLFRTRSLGEL